MSHPNLDIMNDFYDAYVERDMSAVKLVLDENIKWFYPGHHLLSGIKKGINEVISFFDTMGGIMAESNLKFEKLITGANDDYVVECQHVWTNREDGVNLDHYWCVLWKFKGGKIIEGRHFASDQYAVDNFFSEQ
jgi:ketosteroid isomerase-like protein